MGLPSDGQLAFWREMPEGWSFVGELALAWGRAQSTTSEVLSALHAAGFVQRRKSGKTVWYRPRAQVLIRRGGA